MRNRLLSRLKTRDPDSGLNIALASEDSDTDKIVEAVESHLNTSEAYYFVNSVNVGELSPSAIDNLGINGLCPSVFRDSAFAALHRSFERKLLPCEQRALGFGRTLTARLLIETLRGHEGLTCDQIRNVWYTGIHEDGNRLTIQDEELIDQRTKWSFFMARQYQRYPLELFLWCFEDALRNRCRSIEEIIQYWSDRTISGGVSFNGTFEDILQDEPDGLLSSSESPDFGMLECPSQRHA